MAKKNGAKSKNSNARNSQVPKPRPALKSLDRLVGTWKLTGRTFDAIMTRV